jgi:hypothetical protein
LAELWILKLFGYEESDGLAGELDLGSLGTTYTVIKGRKTMAIRRSRRRNPVWRVRIPPP